MVHPEGFEPTAFGSGNQRSNPAELRVQILKMVRPAGLEPATPWFEAKYSDPAELRALNHSDYTTFSEQAINATQWYKIDSMWTWDQIVQSLETEADIRAYCAKLLSIIDAESPIVLVDAFRHLPTDRSPLAKAVVDATSNIDRRSVDSLKQAYLKIAKLVGVSIPDQQLDNILTVDNYRTVNGHREAVHRLKAKSFEMTDHLIPNGLVIASITSMPGYYDAMDNAKIEPIMSQIWDLTATIDCDLDLGELDKNVAQNDIDQIVQLTKSLN